MPLNPPTRADPEIAAATFKEHLNKLWTSGRPTQLGWERTDLDSLTSIVRLPGRRATDPSTVDHFYFRLGAEYYDAAPPTVALVQPELWTPATEGSKWFPVLQAPPWFGLHAAYEYPDKVRRQLVCFTFAAEYYMTDHAPKDSEKWCQGRHTVAATLNRLAEVLSPPYYLKPGA